MIFKKRIILLVFIFTVFAVLVWQNVFAWDVNVIQIYPDKGLIVRNGELVKTASRPIIVNDRLYVPVRTMANIIGATIQWSATQRVATMYVPDFVSLISEIKQKDEQIAKLQLDLKNTGVYSAVLQLISNTYLYKYNISTTSLTYSAIKGMIAYLHDPYTRFFTPQEVKLREVLSSPHVYGVGIELTRSSGKYVVLDVIKDSPAYYSGIVAGDILIAINGTYVSNMPYDDVKLLLSATTSKNITLDLVREGEPLSITLKTSPIFYKDFDYRVIDIDGKKVVYINIREMKQDVVEQMDDALKEIFFSLHGEADAYIIDLRGNFGGDIDVSRELLGFFLGGRKVYSVIDNEGNKTSVYAPVSRWMLSENIPVYLLVDEGTTSAAEVFALAMKSYDRAILVGQTTYGKGVASVVYRLEDGSVLVLTSYEILGPKDEKLNKAGVLPDVWSMTLYAFKQAISLFKRGITHVSELGK